MDIEGDPFEPLDVFVVQWTLTTMHQEVLSIRNTKIYVENKERIMIHDRRCVKSELDNGKEIKLETGLNKAK